MNYPRRTYEQDHRRRYTIKEEAKIRYLRSCGQTYTEIAFTVQRSRTSVWAICNRERARLTSKKGVTKARKEGKLYTTYEYQKLSTRKSLKRRWKSPEFRAWCYEKRRERKRSREKVTYI